MELNRDLEQRLREAACVGDTLAVQELLRMNVDINAKHAINGWTALHWACKRGHLNVAVMLLMNGADKSIPAVSGETPESVCTNTQILELLGASTDKLENVKEVTTPGFVPNYIKNPPLTIGLETILSEKIPSYHNHSGNSSQDELVLKVRIANTSDPDFIEIDLPKNNLTLESLLKISCEELAVDPGQVHKLRKLPNTKLRRDKDVERLENLQEIELVIDALYTELYTPNINNVTPVQSTNAIIPANSYQSISKKDQTILY
ncbi:ankyrin repeat domain-containing protein 40 [Cephus cinctus]|uniref:Ankyrin repeat domain-containing protein 40 n=1 Tax=Cephus cinctus TaxID=211228 RepID=A0AAJ7CG21_CEPCN|nr:ankyrin repeat domain-containing protein 40 [Cephus cinctus]